MRGAIRILGVDPGLRRCGWGVVTVEGARLTHVAHGVIAPPTDAAMSDRLCVLFDALDALIAEHAPHHAAVEEAFMAKNASSALKLGQARAMALLAPARAGLPVAEYAAREIKKSVVGTGGAEKSQVASMVSVLLPGCRATADAADALAVAICHAHTGLTRDRLAAAS
ncbi:MULTISPECIES: crossover junction endodeoxyribonuclease RuvC [Euryhalocaulis]|uniref:crossover junction endodeoxyribonuclease RuvC n=1 Tax=Euryhalocaulis TaxID=1712422 RepID=UPI0003B4E6E9|nr:MULTISPECIES: crossover junction endodeoxyribonuclease RuvC [Euryhalocaulis]MBA4800674.1 crossover junction endodeoxyribonuclease RuvC [Euryhalocaulis sp.]